ncbi:prephenate dehydratase domain-containing protein, partial [Caulobacter sp. S45]|uniref:prephenate dehydratase domain-containing protein n=1 Tax=Caulobacter sp. S45 TaxID=1641861 RepID=UPI00273919ED
MSGKPRIAFQGALGAFSHEACLALLPGAEPTPYPSFDDAFAAVLTGACALALIPSQNTIAGPVPEVAPLLASSGLAVLAEHPWPIRMQLMGVPGGSLAEVRTVASHPMALKQCGLFLRDHGYAAEAAYDTAGAAAELAVSPDRTRAVVAAAAAAELYGLQVLAADV